MTDRRGGAERAARAHAYASTRTHARTHAHSAVEDPGRHSGLELVTEDGA